MVFVILVTIKVKESAVGAMKQKLVEYAAAYRKDEGTLAWHVHQSNTVPTEFSIVERYVNEKSLDVHRANKVYPTFFPWLKPLLDGKPSIQFYNELEVPGVKNFESKL